MNDIPLVIPPITRQAFAQSVWQRWRGQLSVVAHWSLRVRQVLDIRAQRAEGRGQILLSASFDVAETGRNAQAVPDAVTSARTGQLALASIKYIAYSVAASYSRAGLYESNPDQALLMQDAWKRLSDFEKIRLIVQVLQSSERALESARLTTPDAVRQAICMYRYRVRAFESVDLAWQFFRKAVSHHAC